MSALPGLVLFIIGLIGTLLVLNGTDLGDASLAFPFALVLGVILMARAILKP